MKRIAKRVVASIVQNDFAWGLLNSTAFRVLRYAERARTSGGVPPEPRDVVQESIRELFPTLTVRYGPFAGLKYPEAASVGSAIFPKLIGSYEREIREVLGVITRTDYSEIVDIGCAEGYYAVGLALTIPRARVFAFDTDEKALRLCRRMADLNGVSDRVITGGLCDSETLKSLPITRRSLVICDCEGYEKSLFSADVVEHLRNQDLLVEVHDFIDIDISSRLKEVFRATHDIRVIESIDDIKKAQTYEFEELKPFDLATRRTLLGEFRPAIMAWFFMQPKTR